MRLCLAAVAAAALSLGATAVAPARAAAADDIRINEVVTTGSVDDSIELYNKGAASVDLSGWILRDDNKSSQYRIASGTTLAPGGFAVFDVHASFGLGSADQARLYLADGTTLVDGVAWDEHSDPSWSRCPDGTGALVRAAALTLGAANSCGPDGATPTAWPGGSAVTTADGSGVFGSDLSGLFQEGSVMWAAQNSGKLWRLVPDGTGGWKPDTAGGWAAGKALRFPAGSGAPDSEGVTVTGSGAQAGVFVSSERNSASSGTSRLSVLRYDVGGTGSTLTAAREWNLTADLPAVGANLGLEAVTWVPDSALTAAGFKDASTGAGYDPGRYPAHFGGVFLVGVEGTGTIHAYVLAESGAFTRVASFGSGMSTVMELQWEPQASRLWVVCDDTCGGQHRTMRIGASGVFTTAAVHDRPAGMPDLNNEGFSVAGAGECAGGVKPVYWADDGNTGKHALRRGTLSC
ncbi:hypothetical protein GTY92_19375 [Streptomyces sp. SID4950]|nr:hypothetical protein [Streptomyces sp. SID4950]